MYNWRRLTTVQQEELLSYRKLQKRPWHSPTHAQGNKVKFHITGSCFEHSHIIGKDFDRIQTFESELLGIIAPTIQDCFAWAILSNHYHLLVLTEDVRSTLKAIFKLHQRTGFYWNKKDAIKGRKVWFNALEHGIKSDRHFYATVNYIHHNPVKHGYVRKWTDWPFSSARYFLESIGREKALRMWQEYDISEMGDWDD